MRFSGLRPPVSRTARAMWGKLSGVRYSLQISFAPQKILCHWRQTMHIHPGLLLKRGISHPGVVVVEVRPLNPYIALGRPIGLGVLGVLTHPIPIGILIPLRLIVSIHDVLIQCLCGLMSHQTYRFLNLAFIGKVIQRPVSRPLSYGEHGTVLRLRPPPTWCPQQMH